MLSHKKTLNSGIRQQKGLRFPHLSLLLPQFSALNFSAHLMGAVCPWETSLSSQRLWITKQSGLACFTVRWVSPGQMAHNHISVCFSKIFLRKGSGVCEESYCSGVYKIYCSLYAMSVFFCTAHVDILQCIFKSLVHMQNFCIHLYTPQIAPYGTGWSRYLSKKKLAPLQKQKTIRPK